MSIVIVNYGVGNLGSMANMLQRVGAKVEVSGDPEVIDRAERLILPGVGAFDTAMRNLVERDLVDALDRAARVRAVPILGVCLGMQLLTHGSEEGQLAGLGWVEGTVRLLEAREEGQPLPIPHMGWCSIEPTNPSRLLGDLGEPARFYFVHSYAVDCADEVVVGRATYGGSFVAAIEQGNIAGVQFHPEKSHKHGMKLLTAFAGL